MTTPSWLPLDSVWAPHCVGRTRVITVDLYATHGLSGRFSKSRHHRHAAINNIIHRALSTAKIPSRLELSGLYRPDEKHPDTIVTYAAQLDYGALGPFNYNLKLHKYVYIRQQVLCWSACIILFSHHAV